MNGTNLRAVDLNLLRVFLAMWDARSLTAAGARLDLTQPAANHALGRLRLPFDALVRSRVLRHGYNRRRLAAPLARRGVRPDRPHVAGRLDAEIMGAGVLLKRSWVVFALSDAVPLISQTFTVSSRPRLRDACTVSASFRLQRRQST